MKCSVGEMRLVGVFLFRLFILFISFDEECFNYVSVPSILRALSDVALIAPDTQNCVVGGGLCTEECGDGSEVGRRRGRQCGRSCRPQR